MLRKKFRREIFFRVVWPDIFMLTTNCDAPWQAWHLGHVCPHKLTYSSDLLLHRRKAYLNKKCAASPCEHCARLQSARIDFLQLKHLEPACTYKKNGLRTSPQTLVKSLLQEAQARERQWLPSTLSNTPIPPFLAMSSTIHVAWLLTRQGGNDCRDNKVHRVSTFLLKRWHKSKQLKSSELPKPKLTNSIRLF